MLDAIVLYLEIGEAPDASLYGNASPVPGIGMETHVTAGIRILASSLSVSIVDVLRACTMKDA
jgi:hypothetical protein